ncbi:bifunctional DNA primase/polymerase [Actinokineospora enzanensis]|uniref:bifunctional DNA primase/polymerase n=1 Tax=Actinokineospora enzanensis TaxID=155975 RepID=UPI00037EEE25|nr:bifunctional DNA primase/polymerase [Actinokineospora enzanensis]
MNHFEDMLPQHALDAARMGFRVFPLRPGSKRPALHLESRCPGTGACAGGHAKPEQRATTDPAVITRCWAAGPYNIGIATGPSGLVVVDLDRTKFGGETPPARWNREGVRDGHDVFVLLCEEAGQPWPETFTVATPSQGKHLYFRAPAGIELRNTEGDTGNGLGWKIDTRAHGGHVVAAGSVTAAGVYRVVCDAPIAPLPEWLRRKLTPTPRTIAPTPVTAPPDRMPAYVTAALDGERDRVAAAQPGTHDKTLFVAAVALGQLVGAGVLPSATAQHHLHTAAAHMISDRCDCTESKVLRTITNGLRAGATHPRRITPTDPAGRRGAACA